MNTDSVVKLTTINKSNQAEMCLYSLV